jgi:hypothetical protein
MQQRLGEPGARRDEEMKQPDVAEAPSEEGRGLTTAREVLKVLAFLGRRPDGVRASEVATEVGKSISTAYYLLASLCEEGFAIHEPHGGIYRLRRDRDVQLEPDGVGATDDLAGVVEALFRRTHKRSYLGRVEHGTIEIVAVRGRQGMPRIPGPGRMRSRWGRSCSPGSRRTPDGTTSGVGCGRSPRTRSPRRRR